MKFKWTNRQMIDNSTHINFIDINNQDDGEYIISMDVTNSGCPDFKEGRILYLTINNRNKDIWNVEDYPRTKFQIVKVEYNVHESYVMNNVNIDLDVDVYLEKIIENENE